MKNDIIAEKDDELISEVLKIISKEDFENAVTNITDYFNGVINLVTQPELITVQWDDEIYAYNRNGNAACACYRFPYQLEVYGRTFLSTTFDSVDEVVGKDTIVKMKILQGLIYIIIHELSHANQRVDYIRMCYDMHHGKTEYVKYIEETNTSNSHKFIEEHIDEISDEFGFDVRYNLTSKESDIEYEPITLITYYQEILELLLARGFKSEDEYINFMESFEKIVVILNDTQTDIEIIINDNSLVLKEIYRNSGYILFARPVEVNPFIYENFTKEMPQFKNVGISFEDEDDFIKLVVKIDSLDDTIGTDNG